MKRKEKIKTIILFLFVAVMSGCAGRYIPSKAKMIPPTSHTSFVSSGKTLKLREVKGGQVKTSPFVLVSKIDTKDFTEALRDALKNSGIFERIVTEQQADYELQAEIISQEVKIGATTNAILFVHYSLIEITTNQAVWKESLVSNYASKFDEAFDGGLRQKFANEGAVRDNLTQLLSRLSNVLSQLNKK